LLLVLLPPLQLLLLVLAYILFLVCIHNRKGQGTAAAVQ